MPAASEAERKPGALTVGGPPGPTFAAPAESAHVISGTRPTSWRLAVLSGVRGAQRSCSVLLEEPRFFSKEKRGGHVTLLASSVGACERRPWFLKKEGPLSRGKPLSATYGDSMAINHTAHVTHVSAKFTK